MARHEKEPSHENHLAWPFRLSDRYLAPDLAEAANLIREGELVAAVAPELLAEVAP